jgi:cytochrome b subunit of formate dehydrogenase
MNKKRKSSQKILRYKKTNRNIHWIIVVPFMVCYVTALILVFYYNPDPSRPFRAVFSWVHRISGVSLLLLLIIVISRSKHGLGVYFYNIKNAWNWTMRNFKWLCSLGLSTISKRAALPEQGKFNASVSKANYSAAMILTSISPIFIVTGILIWLTDGAVLFWLIHICMAVIATPLLLGHIFMVSLKPKTRVALTRRISGFVGRQYVKHDHAHCYRENFKSTGDPAEINRKTAPDPIKSSHQTHQTGKH